VDDVPTEPKQQFNVYLPPPLIRRAKHAAVDEAVSLSRLVEDALTEHLERLEAAHQR
jgi:predicted HicB family RNase H-like nuclease